LRRRNRELDPLAERQDEHTDHDGDREENSPPVRELTGDYQQDWRENQS
jgi:hypothetical protein